MTPKEQAVPTDNPTAVVIDTNAFHEGRLTRSAMKSLSTLSSLGLHVIVPDVVCRELASHAWQAFESVQEVLVLSAIDVSGVDQPQKIYDTFVDKIASTGATIADSDHGYYRAGVHAQILKAAPASPKGSVTTGAVDYIVYMHAMAAAERYSTVAVVTSDRILRTALASLPGIQVFTDLSTVRKGGVSHMRLPLMEALAPLKHMLSDEFRQALGRKMDPTSTNLIKVVGVGDILRLNEREIVAYIDVAAPSFSGSNADYSGDNIERWQVSLTDADFSIGSNRLISSDDFATWPRLTTPLDEYISTELSMVPSVLRPVAKEDFLSSVKTPLTFDEEPDDSYIEFSVGSVTVAEIHHSTSMGTQEYQHDGDLFIDKTQHTKISLVDGNGLRPVPLAKGALAVLLMTAALDLLTSEQGAAHDHVVPDFDA